jgi:uncharacterized Zn-binding protein involved in type VI secretion
MLPIALVGDSYDDGDTQSAGSSSVTALYLPVARVGDMTTGHTCSPGTAPPVAIATGSSAVTANYLPIARVGDTHAGHMCPGETVNHIGTLVTGASGVTAGG